MAQRDCTGFCCRLNWLLPLLPPPLPAIIESENGLTASLSLSVSLLCVDAEICLYLVRDGKGRVEPNNATTKDVAIRLLSLFPDDCVPTMGR